MGKQRIIFSTLCLCILLSMGTWGSLATIRLEAADEISIEPFYLETCTLPIPAVNNAIPVLNQVQIEEMRQLLQTPANSSIEVTYNGAWSQDAIDAFEFAVAIWERHIVSPVPITVSATWSNLGNGVLGSAGPFFANGPSSLGLDPSLFYPTALINSKGTNDRYANPDINASFNSSFSGWYFGTDGNPGRNQTDFVSVVLHELGHGLGFIGTANIDSNGLGDVTGRFDFPLVYDSLNEDINGVALTNYGNDSAQLATILRTDVFFDGPQGRAANENQRIPLYSPSTFQNGSSYGHLDESFNNTDNALMTFSLNGGEVQHDPGNVMLGMLQDIGWEIANVAQPTSTPTPAVTNTPTPMPSVTPLPTTVPVNTPLPTPVQTATQDPTDPFRTPTPEPTQSTIPTRTPEPVCNTSNPSLCTERIFLPFIKES